MTLAFRCPNAVYGDRTGQMLAQVITSHMIEITVVKGKVIRAVAGARVSGEL